MGIKNKILILAIVVSVLSVISISSFADDFSDSALAANGNAQHYTVLPITFKGGFPIVNVKINNNPISVLFDLGAANIGLSLSKKIIEQNGLSLRYTGTEKKLHDSQGRSAVVKEFVIPKIQLGNFILTNINGSEYHPFPWGAPGPPPEEVTHGVIGLGLISHFNVIIDYQHEKLILIKNDHCPDEYSLRAWKQIHFIFNKNIFTPVRLNDKKNNRLILLWDTGAPFNFIKSGILNQSGIVDLIIDDQSLNHVMFTIQSMEGLPADGVVGAPFFRDHIVYIDFDKKILGIKDDMVS